MKKTILSALILSLFSLNQAIACDKHKDSKHINKHKTVVEHNNEENIDDKEYNDEIKETNNEK